MGNIFCIRLIYFVQQIAYRCNNYRITFGGTAISISGIVIGVNSQLSKSIGKDALRE